MKNYSKPALALLAISMAALNQSAQAQVFNGSDLLLSSSTYSYTGSVTTLSAGSNIPTISPTAAAVSSGTYGPNGVFTNDVPDANFGVTSPITISQITTTGASTGVNINLDPTLYGSTSFASKSELALNLSTDGTAVTFMDYNSTPGNLDVSNSNTPGIIEPGNTDVAAATYRQVVQLNWDGSISTTTTNAYNGNNGRAAVLDSANNTYYTVGNAGNGSGSAATTAAAGLQTIAAGVNATASTPGTIQTGTFSVSEIAPTSTLTYKGDKASKDNNYRGLTVYNGVEYVSKGSGSNGINTVYQVGPLGSSGTETLSVLPGFSLTSAKTGLNPNGTAGTVYHPFGLFFANATTLYVADEGQQSASDIGNAARDVGAGLQKWSLNNGTWQLDYTLTNGLNLGAAYTVSGTNSGNTGTFTAYTDGLGNITGKVNADGTVSIYAVTSTVNNSVADTGTLNDFGSDPNALVAITDTLSDTSASQVSGEDFTTLVGPSYGTVLRGISFAPTPEPSSWLLALGACGAFVAVRRFRRQS
jgi:hypothetical protein